ncbi:hypothetical protein D3C71_1860030 [compost metagenome]
MCSAWQHVQHVLGTDNGQHEGLGIAVNSGEKHPASRFHQLRASANHRTRVRDVLKHLHTGDHVKTGGLLLCEPFNADFPVLNILRPGFKRV